MTIDLKDRLYTSSEVAEILGVSLRSVYRYLEEGKLDADIKTATGRHRFSKKNILDFLQPGGITKEQAEDRFFSELRSESNEVDVLDLPALNKSSVKNQNSELDKTEDFSFDIDEDFFKSLNFDSNQDKEKEVDVNKDSFAPRIKDGDYIDDDLEKLLKEFEEKDLENLSFDTSDSNEKASSLENREIQSDSYVENNNSLDGSSKSKSDFDLDLDEFFKDLENSYLDDVKSENQTVAPTKRATEETQDNKAKENFFEDIDIDFFEDLFAEEPKAEVKKEPEVSYSKPQSTQESLEEKEDNEEDNWLERFRKAAQKNTVSNNSQVNSSPDLNSSFFERSKSNLDNFFENEAPKSGGPSLTESITSFVYDSTPAPQEKYTPKIKEFYYTSSLNGLKEVAQNIDKISRKFDTDYAFTLNAGLSLHKPISPFSTIHVYIRSRDLELFEDYLNLNPANNESEASLCIIVAEDLSVFEDSYELHGLYVVSNVQLRSDLIDRGLDKLAREI